MSLVFIKYLYNYPINANINEMLYRYINVYKNNKHNTISMVYFKVTPNNLNYTCTMYMIYIGISMPKERKLNMY